jgi:DNA-binding CsgD family transcriptional regulator
MHRIDWKSLVSEEEAVSEVVTALQSVGLSGGAFSFTPIGRIPAGRPGPLKRAISLNLNPRVIEEWQNVDLEGRTSKLSGLSQQLDPIRRRMVRQILPQHFVMEKMAKDRRVVRNSVEAAFFRALAAYGVRESQSIPIFTARGEYWSLAAMWFDNNPNQGPLDHETLGQLYWLAANMADFCAEVLNWRENTTLDVRRPLTPREIDCLFWAGQGKTTNETAELLGISTETARKYVKTAMNKLGATSKTQAVCMAFQMGYVPLS